MRVVGRPLARASSGVALSAVGVRIRSSTHTGSQERAVRVEPSETQLAVHEARHRAETVRIPAHDGLSAVRERCATF
jgi:hypothetical protein